MADQSDSTINVAPAAGSPAARPVTPITGVDKPALGGGEVEGMAFVPTGRRAGGLAPMPAGSASGTVPDSSADGTMVRTMSAQSNPVSAPPPPAPAAAPAPLPAAGAAPDFDGIDEAKDDTPEAEEKFFAKTRKAIMVALAFHLDKVNRTMSIGAQSNAIIVIAALQVILGVFTFATAWTKQPSAVDTVFSILAGLVAVIGGCIGIHGARQARKPNPVNQDRGRGELVFFGLIEFWGLTTFTTYLFAGVRDNVSTGSSLCQRATVGLARRVMEGCEDGGTWNALRITCAIVMLVSALAGGYWSFRLKEKLQDAIIAEKVSKTIAEVKDHQGSGYFRSNASFIRSRQAHLPNIDEATPVEADADEPAVLQAVDQILERLSVMFSLDIAKRVTFVKVLCVLQSVLSIVALVAVVVLADNSVAQNTFTAVMSVVASMIGYIGSHRHDRGAIFLYFVLELWGLSTVTTYLISGVKTERANALTCNEIVLTDKSSISSSNGLSNCDSAAVTWVRIVVSMLVLMVTLFSSYAATRLDDHIQSDAANKLHSEEYLEASTRALTVTNKVGVMDNLLPTKSFSSLVGSHRNLNL